MRAAFLLQCLAYVTYAVDVNEKMLGDDDTTTPSTGAADGIWTGHDWSNGVIGVNNGVPYGVDDATKQKIAAS